MEDLTERPGRSGPFAFHFLRFGGIFGFMPFGIAGAGLPGIIGGIFP